MAETRLYRASVDQVAGTGTIRLNLAPSSFTASSGTTGVAIAVTGTGVTAGSAATRVYRADVTSLSSGQTATGQLSIEFAPTAGSAFVVGGSASTRIYRAEGINGLFSATTRVYRAAVTLGMTGSAATRVYRVDGITTIAAPTSAQTRLYAAVAVTGGTHAEVNFLIGGQWVGAPSATYVLDSTGTWVTSVTTVVGPPPPPPPDTFIYGTTLPDATNTGLTGTPLTINAGNIVLTVAGTTLANLDIRGTVKVQAANCSMFNCIIRGNNNFGHLDGNGNTISGEDFLVDTRSGGCVNFVMNRCQTKAMYPNPFYSGVIGHDFTVDRCDISETTDGIGIYNTAAKNPDGSYVGGPSNVVIKGSYLHDLTFYTQAVTGLKVHPSDTKTHNDLIQQQGGTGTIVFGNNMQAFFSTRVGEQGYLQQGYSYGACNSAIQYNYPVGHTCSLIVTYNWIDGGSSALNAAGGVPGIDVGEASYNRFGHKQIYAKGHADNANDTYTIILTSTTTMITNGNYYLDNNQPILVRHDQ